jgi:hypothetical protein
MDVSKHCCTKDIPKQISVFLLLQEPAEGTGGSAGEEVGGEYSGRPSAAGDAGDSAGALSAASSSSAGALGAAANGAIANTEVARFGAAKERKHSLEAGLALFNRSALPCLSMHRLELPQTLAAVPPVD